MISTDRLCPGCMNDSGGDPICPLCGHDRNAKNPEECLPASFWLQDRYWVGKALSANGEGVTYIGWDNSEERIVEVREYFPRGCAIRQPDKTVSIESGKEYPFNEGLMEFLEINRLLMKLSNPNLEHVTAVFEENGTVYAVIRRSPSITLREFLTRNGGTLKWEQAKPLFLPLIDAVAELAEHGLTHGGISGDTVLVGRDGKLHLTGLAVSGVRRMGSELIAQLYPGYAAAEQYETESLQIGRYTDVYGLCATLFRVLVGVVPPEASARLENDSMTISAKAAQEIPHNVLTALANGLQVRPADRTQNAESLKEELTKNEQSNAHYEYVKAGQEPPKPQAEKSEKRKKGSSAKTALISALCTILFFAIAAGILSVTVFRNHFFPAEEPASSQEEIDSVPSVASIGSVDSDAVESVTLYTVPDLTGRYYADLIADEELDRYELVIKGKEYSDRFAKGTVCSQSVAAGTGVERDTKIEIVISLGSREVRIANVVGLSEADAKMELLKQGFLYENIEVIEKYNPDRQPETIVDQEPKYGASVNTETAVKIYINSYKAPEVSSDSGNSSDNFSD